MMTNVLVAPSTTTATYQDMTTPTSSTNLEPNPPIEAGTATPKSEMTSEEADAEAKDL